MRIAFVGNFALTGNQTMATRALPLARLLAAQGHAVRMALPVRGPHDRPGIAMASGVQIHQVSARLPFGPQCYVLQAIRMFRLCLSWQSSVVYCFKPIAHSGAILGALLLLRRVGLFNGRVVLDTDDWEGYGGWNEKQPFPDWVKRLFAWQEKWSLRHADAVVAASRELVHLANLQGAREVLYLPNCLSGDATSDVGAGRRAGPPRVLVYTRFVEYGLDRLLDTFEAIVRRVPDATFIVAGRGLRGEEHDLVHLMAERGLSERASVVGWVKPEDLQSLFASADLALYLLDNNLLNRTKCTMKLVDLASAGVPIVADRVGQTCEYVVDGETGLLVDPGDFEGMAEAAAALIADPARRARMAESAHTRSARWRWPEWLPVLEKALRLTPASPGARA